MQTLLDSFQVAALVSDVARRIGTDYPRGVVLAPILRGGMVFGSDLARSLPGDVRIAPVLARRVLDDPRDAPSGIEVFLPYPDAFDGRDVVLVDAVIDSGLTAAQVRRAVAEAGARSTSIACLLWKRERTTEPTALPQYCGRVIGDLYVVGYGMDDEQGGSRGLSYVATPDTLAVDWRAL